MMHARQTTCRLREQGNILLVSILFLSLLAAFATAQFAVVHSNIRQASFYVAHSELQKYAESGVEVATHDITHGLTATPGAIGTANWTAANDVGRDGVAGTGDEGEADGLPTPGESNVQPQPIGPAKLNAGLIVYVENPGAAVQRIVATAANADAMVSVETYLQRIIATLPRFGAMYVSPNVALDLKGNAFSVNGNDHKIDGTPVAGGALHGISTSEGAVPGDNTALLLAQVDAMHHDQIIGLGGEPSVGEVAGVDFDGMYDDLKAARTVDLPPGSYDHAKLGDAAAGDFPVTYSAGDLELSGKGIGAGVLIVEGSLTITGMFEFTGLIIVRGDILLAGGGAGIHVYGSVAVGESFTAVEPDEIGLAGQADIYYSSEALDLVEQSYAASYSKVYYDDK